METQTFPLFAHIYLTIKIKARVACKENILLGAIVTEITIGGSSLMLIRGLSWMLLIS